MIGVKHDDLSDLKPIIVNTQTLILSLFYTFASEFGDRLACNGKYNINYKT